MIEIIFFLLAFLSGPHKIQEAREGCGAEEGTLSRGHEEDDVNHSSNSSGEWGERQAQQRGQAAVQVRGGGHGVQQQQQQQRRMRRATDPTTETGFSTGQRRGGSWSTLAAATAAENEESDRPNNGDRLQYRWGGGGQGVHWLKHLGGFLRERYLFVKKSAFRSEKPTFQLKSRFFSIRTF